MNLLDLTIILPAYNVGSFIIESLATLLLYMDRSALHYEIIVVDDGSKDETPRCLMAVNDNRVRVFTLSGNQGKGAAIKRGIEAARGKYIVTTDADLPYGAESVLVCFQALQEGALLAIGDRTLLESRVSLSNGLVRRMLGTVYSMLLKPMLYSSGLRDVRCGIKGFSLSFAKEFVRYSKINRFAFDIELVVFALENQISVTKLPVVFMVNNPSSVRIFADSLNMLGDLFRILWHKRRGYYRFVDPGQVG